MKAMNSKVPQDDNNDSGVVDLGPADAVDNAVMWIDSLDQTFEMLAV